MKLPCVSGCNPFLGILGFILGRQPALQIIAGYRYWGFKPRNPNMDRDIVGVVLVVGMAGEVVVVVVVQ